MHNKHSFFKSDSNYNNNADIGITYVYLDAYQDKRGNRYPRFQVTTPSFSGVGKTRSPPIYFDKFGLKSALKKTVIEAYNRNPYANCEIELSKALKWSQLDSTENEMFELLSKKIKSHDATRVFFTNSITTNSQMPFVFLEQDKQSTNWSIRLTMCKSEERDHAIQQRRTISSYAHLFHKCAEYVATALSNSNNAIEHLPELVSGIYLQLKGEWFDQLKTSGKLVDLNFNEEIEILNLYHKKFYLLVNQHLLAIGRNDLCDRMKVLI